MADTTVPLDGLRALAGWADAFADPGFSAGAWAGGDRLPDGSIQMPYYDLSPEATRFVREMYAAGMVRPVGWMDWVATERGRALMEDPGAVASADGLELVFLVTAIVRGERFADGTIAGALERGSLLAAARRAADLVGEMGDGGRGAS